MSWIATAIVGSSLIGANAAKSAASTQADASRAGQALLQQNFEKLSPNFEPYMQTGQIGLNQLQQNIGGLTQGFGPEQLQQNLAPNYQFQLQQGQNATNLANNATGGLIGGNALKGLQDYTQNTAQNAYQNAFNNYQTQQGNIYNRLVGLAGIGQSGLTGLSNLATGNATNQAQLGVGGANAQAAGTVGSANALAGGLNQYGNQQYLSTLLANKQPVVQPNTAGI